MLIADDHRLFGQALEAILATDDRLEVIGHASDGAEAVQLGLNVDPDVILMDIAMPIMDGLQATKQIQKQKPQACILMLTGSNSRTTSTRRATPARRLRDEGPHRRGADRCDLGSRSPLIPWPRHAQALAVLQVCSASPSAG